MNVVTWARVRVGQVVTAPGGLGGQCVDLANVYLVARMAALVRRNAADWALPGILPGWTWEPNGPVNAPPAGGLVVWRRNVTLQGIGQYGHVAIALAADPGQLLTLDQGWPEGAPVSLVWHPYVGVAGWWIPPR